MTKEQLIKDLSAASGKAEWEIENSIKAMEQQFQRENLFLHFTLPKIETNGKNRAERRKLKRLYQ